MKKSWLIPVMVAVIVGAMAYGLTRWTVCSRCRPAPDRLEDSSFLRRELRLGETQSREIAKLHAALNATLADCCRRHCAARVRLGPVLCNETNGVVQARLIIGEMGRAYEAGELATLEHIQRVRALLNPQQKKRFDELIAECACRSCPMCGGRAAAAPKAGSAD
ncbi:MAG: Spy/CpxP family protein refolding chaperone [Kiritimatiellia bacterium]|jgi:hypothetical protein